MEKSKPEKEKEKQEFQRKITLEDIYKKIMEIEELIKSKKKVNKKELNKD